MAEYLTDLGKGIRDARVIHLRSDIAPDRNLCNGEKAEEVATGEATGQTIDKQLVQCQACYWLAREKV